MARSTPRAPAPCAHTRGHGAARARLALGTTGTLINFGTTSGTSVNCVSSTECHVVSLRHAVGVADVKVTVGGITSPKSAQDQFTFH